MAGLRATMVAPEPVGATSSPLPYAGAVAYAPWVDVADQIVFPVATAIACMLEPLS